MSTLYLVATPIGNLEDITYRAVRVLSEVDCIACEDTRHSLKLLNHLTIKKPLISYHKFSEQKKSIQLLEKLDEGKNIALISDAGMPCISDPGAVICKLARQAGHNVTVIPGANAVTSAVALIGIDKGFCFLGFIPEKNKLKKEMLENVKNLSVPVAFYSSPYDINSNIKDIYNIMGNREVFAVKELTKMHEKIYEGNLENFEIENPKGEFVLVIMPSEEENFLNHLSIKEHVEHYLKNGYTKKDAIKLTAKDRDVNKNVVYQEMLNLGVKNVK